MKLDNMKSIFIFVAGLMMLFSNPVNAELLWMTNSFTFLYGEDYEVGDSDRYVFTFESASNHSWGDIFLFADRLTHKNDDNHETYGELQPNISFFKLRDKQVAEDAAIKDFYLATQWEYSSNAFTQFNNYLYGLGVNVNFPGSRYFKVNYYRRNNDLYDGNNQFSIFFSFPFKERFLIDGFLDAVDSVGERTSGYNLTTQWKYDLAPSLNMKSGHLYIGVEYVYWKNKFGIDGVNEHNPNLLVKWHF